MRFSLGVLVMKRKSLPASRDRSGTVWQGLTNSHFSHHITRETYFTQEIAAPQKSSSYDTSDERQAQEPPETVQSSSPRNIKRTYACILYETGILPSIQTFAWLSNLLHALCLIDMLLASTEEAK
jgi:hypothetical protein